MIELNVKNELELKVYINGIPTIENMLDIDYKLLIDELEQMLEEELYSKQKDD